MSLKISVGPEQVIMEEGLQPFMLVTKKKLMVMAQMPVPLGTVFPGVWGSVMSGDGGLTWEPTCNNLPYGCPFFEGTATQLRDGTILYYEWSARGPYEGGKWMLRRWEVDDDLTQWRGPVEAPIILPQAKGGFDDDGHPAAEVFIHRTLLELPNGDLLMTAYGWFEEDDTPSTYRPSMNKFRTLLLRSSDKGHNWSLVTTVAVDPTVGEESFNEPAMVRLSHGPHAGRLIMLLRTGSNKTYPHNPIYQTESDDEGLTWTTPRALDFENVDPEIIEMADGTLVASYGIRTMESRVNIDGVVPKVIGEGHGNWIAFSRDHGATWTQHTRVTAVPSTCYTCVHEIAPGRLVFIYDIGDAWQHKWIGFDDMPRGIGCRFIDVVPA